MCRVSDDPDVKDIKEHIRTRHVPDAKGMYLVRTCTNDVHDVGSGRKPTKEAKQRTVCLAGQSPIQMVIVTRSAGKLVRACEAQHES